MAFVSFLEKNAFYQGNSMGSLGEGKSLSPEFFTLLRYCLALALLIHLPFIGMAIGGSAVSLVMNFLGREKKDQAYLRFSKELIETVTVNKKVLFFFGLVPLLPVALIYQQLLAGFITVPWLFWLFVFVVLFFGFTLLAFYRATFTFQSDFPAISFGTGTMGHLMLVLASLFYILGTGIIFDPETLPFLQKQIIHVLSWNSFLKFCLYMALFFGITGGAILFFIDGRSRGGETSDAEYRKLAGRTGTILAFPATLLIPLLVVGNLVTLPDVAISGGVFAISGAIMILAMAVCVILSLTFNNPEGRSHKYVFTLYILIFLAVLVNDNFAIGNAFLERSVALRIQAEEKKAEQEALRGKPEIEKPAASLQMGETVYDTRCSSCHLFESRLVGPPLHEVLPKYRENPEGLKGFIRKPVLVNPDYPPMLEQGLTDEEIESVASYILDRYATAVEMGSGVFEKRCSGCHSFDSRVVGPPLHEVLPKYRNNLDGLRGFIGKPVKVNPDYPPMPEQGLTDEEIESVASYVLDVLGSKK